MDSKKSEDNGLSWIKDPQKMISSRANETLTKNQKKRNRKRGRSSVRAAETKVENGETKKAEVPIPIEEEKVQKESASTSKIAPENSLINDASKTNLEETKNTVSEKQKAGLELIEAVIKKFKTDDEHFINVLDKMMALFNKSDSKNRKTKVDLLDLLINNLLKANKDELDEMKKHIKSVFLSANLVKYFMNTNQTIEYQRLIAEDRLHRAYLGKLKPENKTVIVKSSVAKQIIFEEAILLSQLDHPNVLGLLAIDRSMNELVFEYMDCEELAFAIVKHKINLSSKNLLKLLADVARGMEYLHSKNILHRNLTTENIFVNKKNECKIGNFAGAVYVGDSNGEYIGSELEFLYSMAPESMDSNKYTFKTDVWSMGIVCWETFKMISTPNYVLAPYLIKCAIMNDVRRGSAQLEFSPVTPQSLYYYTKEKILHKDPSRRPTFSEIKNVIENIQV